MSFWEVRRSIVSAQLLTRLAAERGIPMAVCLKDTSITPEALSNPETEISAAQEIQLVRNLVVELGHIPGIGLEAGSRYHLSAYGIWGFAMVSSPTFRSGCEVAVRYLDLSYAFTRFSVEELDSDAPRVRLDDAAIPQDVQRFLVERDFAAFVNAIQEMRPGGVQLRGLQFRFPRPEYSSRFVALCGVEPKFDAPANMVFLDPESLNLPLPQANPLMARLCEERCRQLLAKRQVRTGFAGKVRDHLLRAPHRIAEIDAVASGLNMAPRTLRRRLEDEGTSFRTLVDEVRQALAEELLTAAHMKLEEVAARLGYSEPAAFIHAFRRWKGISPTEFRAAQKSASSSEGPPGDAAGAPTGSITGSSGTR